MRLGPGKLLRSMPTFGGCRRKCSSPAGPKSGTSVALIPGGITTEQGSPELVSLGTLYYQPLWVFSRGSLPQKHEPLRGPRVSIGPEGSSSRALSLELLGRARLIDPKSATLLALTPAESAQALLRGEIDVAIFLDGWESPAVQRLLKTKDINLESIPRADAFVRIYPYLNKLVLPAGVVDMAEPRPPTDVILIAPKASLAAIQNKAKPQELNAREVRGMWVPLSTIALPSNNGRISMLDLPP